VVFFFAEAKGVGLFALAITMEVDNVVSSPPPPPPPPSRRSSSKQEAPTRGMGKKRQRTEPISAEIAKESEGQDPPTPPHQRHGLESEPERKKKKTASQRDKSQPKEKKLLPSTQGSDGEGEANEKGEHVPPNKKKKEEEEEKKKKPLFEEFEALNRGTTVRLLSPHNDAIAV